jgi:hypothetical protein
MKNNFRSKERTDLLLFLLIAPVCRDTLHVNYGDCIPLLCTVVTNRMSAWLLANPGWLEEIQFLHVITEILYNIWSEESPSTLTNIAFDLTKYDLLVKVL